MIPAAYCMDADSALALDPQLFQDNMAALRQVDAALAVRVEQAAGGLAGVELARARDGSLSFRLSQSDGRRTWFGRSSIPTIRAEVLLEKFDTGAANVLLPGISQGQEVSLLLQRLGRHRAVFVWETEIAFVVLSMRLHRWAEAIQTGRCIFIVCPPDQLAATLLNWLGAHPGHLCPERIMMWPWSTMQDLAGCRAAVQAVYSEIDRCRAASMARESADYASKSPATQAGIGGAMSVGPMPVVALQIRDDLRLLADAIVESSSTAGVAAVPLLVNGPGDVHPLARLRTLRRACATPPPVALLLDCSRGQLKEVLSDRTSAIIWLGPAAHSLPVLASGAGQHDLLIATGSRVRDRVHAAGWSRPAPPVVPYPCLVEPDEFADPAGARPVDVMLVADASPTSPEAYGFHLDTHAQLWRTASDIIKGGIETFVEEDAASVLLRAEKKLGFQLEEEGVRKAMLESLGSTLANSLSAAYLAPLLLDDKLNGRIMGHGWAGNRWGDRVHKAGGMRDCFQLFSRVKLVVFCDVTGEVTMLALMAAAAGAVVVWRAHSRDVQPGGIAMLLEPDKEMFSFRYARDLTNAVRRLVASAGDRCAMASAAQARCQATHMPKDRLKALEIAASSYVSVRNTLV